MQRYLSHGLDGLILLLIMVTLMLTPLRIGGVEQQSIILLFFSACVLFALSWFRQLIDFNLHNRVSVPMQKCIFALIGLVLYLLFQILPMPEFIIRFISPASSVWWAPTGAYGLEGFATLSLDISNTIWYMITAAIYFIFFMAIIFLVDTKRKFNLLLFVIFVLGLFQILFDLISKYIGYNLFTPAQLDGHIYRLTGTFTNSNNVSALINLSFSCGAALIYNLYTKFKKNRSAMAFLFATIIALSLPILIYGSIKAGSNGGMLSLLCAVAIIVIVKQYNRFSLRSILLFLVLCAAFFVAIIFFGSREINLIELTENLSLTERKKIWLVTLTMWRDFIVFGVGAGAFEWVLPIYKDDFMPSLRVSNAHSGHLQSLVELGLFGVAIIIMFVCFYIQCLKGLIDKLEYNSAIFWIILVGITAFLIHETIDNHFLIPAVGLPFFCMLAMLASMLNIKSQEGV